jgi:hypothetical protein
MATETDKPYLINVIFNHNNYGLSNDAKILVNTLRKFSIHGFNCKVRPVQSFQTETAPVDLNIFLEIVNPLLVHVAKVNVLVPNQEWFYRNWTPYLDRLDFIWCKTEYARELFQQLVTERQYSATVTKIGWTSLDRHTLLPNRWTAESTWPQRAIHVAGGSQYKSTQLVIDTWKSEWMPLTVVINTDRLPKVQLRELTNITYVTSRLSDAELTDHLNQHPIHICPSETEGFGHYLNEARSCESVVVTVDAPPMNQFSDPEFCLPVTTQKMEHTLGDRVSWKPEDFIQLMEHKISNLTTAEIQEYGKKNRRRFLELGKEFNQLCYASLQQSIRLVNSGYGEKISREMKLNISELPYITIVTLCHNRKEFFPLALSNYLGTDYPPDKLEWRIIDSSDPDQTVQDLIPEDNDNIHYHWVEPEDNTIGAKRNLGVHFAKGEYIAMMDDDDIYLPRHLLLRLANLQHYHKQCCYCSSIACFHISKIISTINVPPLPWPPEGRVAEASLIFSKKFWEQRGFNSEDRGREGVAFLQGRYEDCTEISWKEIMVSLLHSKNTSNRVTVGDTPNGCHFGFSDQLFQLITGLDSAQAATELLEPATVSNPS